MTRKTRDRGTQQGPQRHAEGEHGAKTREFIRREQITTRPDDRENGKGPVYSASEIAAHDDVGRDRLFDGREQHDEAEKNSEKTRQARDIDRHGHDSANELLRKNRQSRARRM